MTDAQSKQRAELEEAKHAFKQDLLKEGIPPEAVDAFFLRLDAAIEKVLEEQG